MCALEKREQELLVDQQVAATAEDAAKKGAEQAAASTSSTQAGIAKLEADLSSLCPLVIGLCKVVGGANVEADDGGMLSIRGCRVDTLTDYLRLLDVAVKELHARAGSLPTAAGNEWLRDFLQPKVVTSHPNVTELRKELEAAAQKQKEQKEAKAMGADESLAMSVVGADEP